MNTNELYHYGVKGMKWGVRKDRIKNTSIQPPQLQTVVLSKRGESVELYRNPKSTTAKFLAKVIPGLKDKQDRYTDYSIKDKEGKIVGSISTNMDSDRTLNIAWLCVNNKSEGKGYGQSAMRTIIEHAKRSGFKEMTLEVPTTSPNARHIYEKLGFKETGEKMIGDKNDIWGGLTEMRLEL